MSESKQSDIRHEFEECANVRHINDLATISAAKAFRDVEGMIYQQSISKLDRIQDEINELKTLLGGAA